MIIFKVVVLPAPLGPSRPITLPSGREKLRPFKAGRRSRRAPTL